MKSHYHIKNTFFKQRSHNDCGMACLGMILNYCGREAELPMLRQRLTLKNEGSSLLDLRNAANAFNLDARCVAMDIAALRACRYPCILHVVNGEGRPHFTVCFKPEKTRNTYRYLVGDPAKGIYYLPETDLLACWQSRGALYFERIDQGSFSLASTGWGALFSLGVFPKELWISIPLVNACSALMGIAISWVLQKGMETSLADNKLSLIISVIVLLLLITLFKSGLSYLKQRILIVLNTSVHRKLTARLIPSFFASGSADSKMVNAGMAEIQKIQNALSAFAAVVLSDGLLVVLILSGLFYARPVIAAVNLLYILVTAVLTIVYQPVFSRKYAHLADLAGKAEKEIISGLRSNEQAADDPEKQAQHRSNYEQVILLAGSIAVKISRINLAYECLGALMVIAVFASGLKLLNQQSISYGSFMVMVIVSYLLSVLMQKICNAIYVITDGAEATRLNKDRLF